MEINKPNQTDPTAAQPSQEDLIRDRVLEAVNANKDSETPLVAPVVEAPVSNKPVGGTGSDVIPPKDSSPTADPNQEVLKLVEASTGRKFDKLEEAQKYLSNLNSLVGDQSVAKARESAKLFDTFLSKWADKNGETVDNAKKFWADQLISQPEVKPVANQPETKQPKDNEELNTLKEQVAKLEDANQQKDLLAKYPYAAEVKDEVSIIAKQKGVSQLEAFENSPFKALLEAKSKEDSSKSPVVTPSNRIGFDTKKIQELGARVASGKGSNTDREALVSEYLGLK